MVVNLYVYHLDLCTSDKCLGIGASNRITFALAVFFLLHALLLRCFRSCSRLDMQTWWAKLFIFAVLLVCAWLIPDSFYGVYMHAARFVSIGFLLLQVSACTLEGVICSTVVVGCVTEIALSSLTLTCAFACVSSLVS